MGDKSNGKGREEDEDELLVPTSDERGDNFEVGFCLMGRIWMNKTFNVKVFMNTILVVWNPKYRV